MKNWMLAVALLSVAMSGGARKHKEEKAITIEYDRFTQTTSVRSAWLRLPPASKWNGRGLFSLAALYTCPGDTARCNPEIVTLLFDAGGPRYASGQGWRWLDFHKVVILADGERCVPRKVEWEGDSQSMTEFVAASYASAQLLKIVDAARIEGRIGTEEFRIDDENRAKLNAFANVLRNGLSEP